MTSVVIDVFNVRSYVKGVIPKPCIDQIKFATSYAVQGAFFSKAYKNHYWDGRKHLFNVKDQSFPTGLLSKIRFILNRNNISYTIKDCRTKPQPSLDVQFNPPFNLRNYQQQTIDLSLLKQRGIARAATGSGKSLIIAGIAGAVKVPTLILVHKLDIFWQLIKTLETSLNTEIGVIGAGHVEPKAITVAMIQTIARVFDPELKIDKEDEDTEIMDPENLKAFIQSIQCVITDECHHLNLGTYEAVLQNCTNAFYRIGLSATPYRTDNADIVIEAHTGPKFIDISASKLIEEGVLAVPHIFMYEFKHSRQSTALSYQELYTNEIVKNNARNELIVHLTAEALRNNKTVLIAVTRVEHGKILEEELKKIEPTAIFASGALDSKTRQEILNDLDEQKRKVVICTTVFGEGVNVPSLNVLINAKAQDSTVDSMQLVGRVLRITPNKNRATIVDIMDTGCRHLESHSKSRFETFTKEPKYNVKVIEDLQQVTYD
jgi:superfamily II DNA or RNA helicase